MDDIILQIKALLEAGLTSAFKKYFYGENKVPEESIMPFIEVIPTRTSMVTRGTGGLRDNEYSVTVNIKDDLKHHLTANTDKDIISGQQFMVKKMEERDANGVPLSATVLGILNENLQLNTKAHIIDNWEISYDTSPFGGSYILIASITFSVKKITP